MTDWTSPLAGTYDGPRPEPYLAGFARLGYVQPDHMVAAAERLAPELGDAPTILDIGCGYGTFGAVLRRVGTMAALVDAAAAGALARPGALPRRDGPLSRARIVGLDVAAHAVRFAESAGFVDEGIVDDLTTGPPGPAAARSLATVDLVVEVGVEWTALGRLLPHLLPALVRPLVLLGPRGDAPTAPVFAALERAGYVGTRLTDGPVRFRRFADAAERDAALARERTHGATAPSDAEGYRSHLFLYRPAG